MPVCLIKLFIYTIKSRGLAKTNVLPTYFQILLKGRSNNDWGVGHPHIRPQKRGHTSDTGKHRLLDFPFLWIKSVCILMRFLAPNALNGVIIVISM